MKSHNKQKPTPSIVSPSALLSSPSFLQKKLIKMTEDKSSHNYHPLDVVLCRGEGAYVWDVDGNTYLDFLACYSALNFGHTHPKLIECAIEQLQKFTLCSRAFYSEELSYFASELCAFTGLDRMLPMNSGAEAVETAIKIARKWGYIYKNISEKDGAEIIVFDNNFHGRTITIISFSTNEEYKYQFGPFTPGFRSCPFNDIEALKSMIHDKTVAVLIEPIQAEAGILIPDAGYLSALQELCHKHRVLTIFDEIQTGLGRTGKDFCFQHEEGLLPDMLILGKSLGGGIVPVSAVIGKDECMNVLHPGEHGSTFGGNPLGAALGRKTIQLLQTERFSDKAKHIEEKAMEYLRTSTSPYIKEIRGKGALIGIELTREVSGARAYCEALKDVGVLCKETHDWVIRIAPPLVISDSDLIMGLEKIKSVLMKKL